MNKTICFDCILVSCSLFFSQKHTQHENKNKHEKV